MTEGTESKKSIKILEIIQIVSTIGAVLGIGAFFLIIVVTVLKLEKYVGITESIRHGVEFLTLSAIAFSMATSAFLISNRVREANKSIGSSEQIIKEATEHLDKVANEVRETKKIAFDAAFSVVEKVFGFSKPSYDIPDNKRILQLHEEWMGGLKYNFNAWDDRLRHSLDEPGYHQQFALTAWLTAGKSYFREEAYDIHRGELVTNARNYVYILAGLVAELVQYAKKNNQVLYYYAITPTNPKDWYQYPHGRAKPYLYYEEEFVSIFYRSLSEIVQSNREHLNHRRYIICSQDAGNDDVRKKISNKIGCYIESQEKLEADLKSIVVQLAPLKGTTMPSFFHQCYDLYNELTRELYPSINLRDKHFVYMWSHDDTWNKKWKETPSLKKYVSSIESFILGLPINATMENKNFWIAVVQASLKEYREEWTQYRQEIFDKVLLLLQQGDTTSRDAWVSLWDINKWTDNGFNYAEMLNNCHHLSITLQQDRIVQFIDSLPDKSRRTDLIHKLIYMGLTYRDLSRRVSPLPQRLLEEFGTALHTDGTKGLFLLPIKSDEDEGINKFWLTQKVEPEVSLFGIGEKDSTPEKINWGLAVTGNSLNYPFEVLRIQFKTGEKDIEIYKNCLNQIGQQAISAADL